MKFRHCHNLQGPFLIFMSSKIRGGASSIPEYPPKLGRPCIFFMNSTCMKGDYCRFSHDEEFNRNFLENYKKTEASVDPAVTSEVGTESPTNTDFSPVDASTPYFFQMQHHFAMQQLYLQQQVIFQQQILLQSQSNNTKPSISTAAPTDSQFRHSKSISESVSISKLPQQKDEDYSDSSGNNSTAVSPAIMPAHDQSKNNFNEKDVFGNDLTKSNSKYNSNDTHLNQYTKRDFQPINGEQTEIFTKPDSKRDSSFSNLKTRPAAVDTSVPFKFPVLSVDDASASPTPHLPFNPLLLFLPPLPLLPAPSPDMSPSLASPEISPAAFSQYALAQQQLLSSILFLQQQQTFAATQQLASSPASSFSPLTQQEKANKVFPSQDDENEKPFKEMWSQKLISSSSPSGFSSPSNLSPNTQPQCIPSCTSPSNTDRQQDIICDSSSSSHLTKTRRSVVEELLPSTHQQNIKFVRGIAVLPRPSASSTPTHLYNSNETVMGSHQSKGTGVALKVE